MGMLNGWADKKKITPSQQLLDSLREVKRSAFTGMYEQVIFIEMAYGHTGYLPDSETEKLGGFGTLATMVYDTADTEQAILECFSRLAKQL